MTDELHPALILSNETDDPSYWNIVDGVPVYVELDRLLGVIELVPPFVYVRGGGWFGYDLQVTTLVDMPSTNRAGGYLLLQEITLPSIAQRGVAVAANTRRRGRWQGQREGVCA